MCGLVLLPAGCELCSCLLSLDCPALLVPLGLMSVCLLCKSMQIEHGGRRCAASWPAPTVPHLLLCCRVTALQAERASVFAAAQQQQQQVPPGLLAVRVFTACYSGPLEKAGFQGAVARESSVFADLIRAKQHLVLPLDMGQSSLQQVMYTVGCKRSTTRTCL